MCSFLPFPSSFFSCMSFKNLSSFESSLYTTLSYSCLCSFPYFFHVIAVVVFIFWPIFHFRVFGSGTCLHFLWTAEQSKILVLLCLVFSCLTVMNSKVICSVFPKVPTTSTSLTHFSLFVRIKSRAVVLFLASFAVWMMKLLIERQLVKERSDFSSCDFWINLLSFWSCWFLKYLNLC